MRRKDREITDKNELIKIIEKCDVCRIALSDNNTPYIIPMNFGYEYNCGNFALYFHCAKEGRKLDIIRVNPNVCFEFDCSHKLIAGSKACNYTMEYESVIGNGKIIIIDDNNFAEKQKALTLIMRKYASEKNFNASDFSEADINSVKILKLSVGDVGDITGKRLIKI